MATREILHYQNSPILRKKSREVEDVNDRIVQLIDDMVETLHKAEGAGLAAPQVGILKRVAVIDIGEGVIELVNPEIIKVSGKQIDFEGCLSIPGAQEEVERPMKVTVKALDRNGREITVKGSGLLARAFCHEIDHLNGVLFIDHVK